MGSCNFLLAGFHQLIVYKPGTRPEDINAIPTTSLLLRGRIVSGWSIDDLTEPYFTWGSIRQGGRSTVRSATPDHLDRRCSDTKSNVHESCGIRGISCCRGCRYKRWMSLPKAEPGVYLVICNVRGHFLDGMFAFVKVKAAGRGRGRGRLKVRRECADERGRSDDATAPGFPCSRAGVPWERCRRTTGGEGHGSSRTLPAGR